jgi:drug/metabolite transporter (DMT)-like permease
MEQPNGLPEENDSAASRDTEHILRSVTQNLQNLQQDLVAQLTQDVKRLQVDKSRLLSDIEKLQAQQRSLQEKQQISLSQQQLAQQQLWAKQLAQALASQLHSHLIEQVSQSLNLTASKSLSLPGSAAANSSENSDRMLASLDQTINRTLHSVQQDLISYQSALAQQISQMHNLEQQGEAILEALVIRLSQQLQVQGKPRIAPHPESRSQVSWADHSSGKNSTAAPDRSTDSVAPTAPSLVRSSPLKRSPRSSNLSQFQIGLLLVLLSTVALSLHNVVVGVIGNVSKILGFYEVGGFIQLNFGNALLILWMRMLVVVPLMAAIAKFLYPAAWRDIRSFLQLSDRRLLRSVIGSGFFLFLSQVLIYTAIGQVGPGVAVTILFMYPLVTVPLAWLLFKDRPTALRIGVMVSVLFGVVLTAFPKLSATTNISWSGISTAALAGIAFACYLIATEISFRKLHPVPVSLVQFATIFILTSLSLIIRPTGLGVDLLPEGRLGLIVGGLILGILTLLGYLFNNFGIRFIGAAQVSILAAIGPALTALLAFVLVPGSQTALKAVQWLGIGVVTAGVLALAFERMFLQAKSAKLDR